MFKTFKGLRDAPITPRDPGAVPDPGLLAALSLPILMASLDTSIANAALPLLSEALHATLMQVQWVVLGYLLTLTATVVSVGRLGDLIGRRRLLLIGISVFTIASLGCGIAPDLGCLIAARAAQGIGAATMLALTPAIASSAVPSDASGRTIGLLGTMSAIGTALGPSLGGLMASAWSWRAIFLVNLPLGLVSLALAARSLPADRARTKSSVSQLDLPGTLLLAVTLAAYALAMTRGLHPIGLVTLELLLASVLGLGLFVRLELRAASPLLPLRVLRDPVRSAGLGISALVATVVMTTLVVGPFHLARALGLSPGQVGLVLSVGPTVVALMGVPAGRAVDHFGAAAVTRAGLLAMAAGSLLLCLAPTALGLIGYLAPLVLLTAGYALFQTSNNTAIILGLPSGQRGVMSGLLSLARNLGLISGASLMGGVFAAAVGSDHILAASPAAVAIGTRTTFGVAAALMAAALAIAQAGRTLHFSHPLAHDEHPAAAACNTLERK